jgi:alkanesulfonate monooxygenase SsuD/methylene tetrahydromethanopterin reductase-like flavin-dependent oxidoreductase (luciferase family)
MAGITHRCRIGPLVTTFQYHSSLSLARHIVTVDALSDGRLDLGVGIGGAPIDRAFGGIPDDSLGALAERLDRCLVETLALLNGERIPVPPAPVLLDRPGPSEIALSTPSPQGGRIPIVVGGHGRRALEIAAKYADCWNTYGARAGEGDAFEALQRQSDQLTKHCIALGRDPKEISRSALLDFSPQLSPSTPLEMTEVVRHLHAIGFHECIAFAWLDGVVTRSTEDLLDFVVHELPHVRAQLD